MKNKEVISALSMLEDLNPDQSLGNLKASMEKTFGEIKWANSAGYGEGEITCEFIDQNVKGSSSGLCTSEEALLDALVKIHKKKEWHKKYVQAMVDAGVDQQHAKEALKAGMGHYDYSYSPEDAAHDEMSYWDG